MTDEWLMTDSMLAAELVARIEAHVGERSGNYTDQLHRSVLHLVEQARVAPLPLAPGVEPTPLDIFAGIYEPLRPRDLG